MCFRLLEHLPDTTEIISLAKFAYNFRSGSLVWVAISSTRSAFGINSRVHAF